VGNIHYKYFKIVHRKIFEIKLDDITEQFKILHDEEISHVYT